MLSGVSPLEPLAKISSKLLTKTKSFLLLSFILASTNSFANFNLILNQSYIHSSKYDYFSQFKLHDIILNYNGDYFSAQLVLDDEKLKLGYGFFKYNLINNSTIQDEIFIGKIRPSFGFYNKIQDIPSATHLILVPQTIYQYRIKDFYSGYYSITNILKFLNFEDFYIELENGVGYPELDDDLEETFLLIDCNDDLKNHGLSFTNNLRIEYQNLWKLNFSLVRSGFEYRNKKSKLCDLIMNRGYFDLTPILISFEYNINSNLIFTSETLFNRIKKIDIYNENLDDTAFSYFLMLSWYPNTKWSFYISKEFHASDIDDFSGKELSLRTGLPQNIFYSDIWTVGLKYNFNENFVLGLFYQKHHGTSVLDNTLNPISKREHDNFDVFGVRLYANF